MGRGLGIFPARPKTPFVPGEAPPGTKGPFVPGGGFTRDKSPPYISFLPHSPFPQTLVSFGAAAVRSPAPPTARAQCPRAPPPSTSPPRAPASAAAVDVRHPGPGPVPPRLRRPGLHSARTPSSSPPPAASTARRRAATLSAARHRAASSTPRRPGPGRARS